MDQESTSPEDAIEAGQESAASTEGQTPALTEGTKTFDETYVKQLRKEAAQSRTKLTQTESRLRELEDRDKTDAEKLSKRAADMEARATEAEARLIRFEVAAEKGLDPAAIAFLTGSTREEIETRADDLARLLQEKAVTPTSFDGGARQASETKQSPELEHNALLLRALGRGN